jgi:hypothetical protein
MPALSPIRGGRSSQTGPNGHAMTRAHHHGWNLFRRRHEVDLWCAVPSDHSVPGFLFSGEWGFGGVSQLPDSEFRKLQDPEARWAVQWNGFYLFMCFSAASGLAS